MQQKVSSIAIESVGTVRVSTVKFKDAARGHYWETAIVWPSDWEGSKYCADEEGLDIIACDRARDDADETHQHWSVSERLARMAHNHITRRRDHKGWHGGTHCPGGIFPPITEGN